MLQWVLGPFQNFGKELCSYVLEQVLGFLARQKLLLQIQNSVLSVESENLHVPYAVGSI